VDTLRTLVAFDTTSRLSNLPLIDWAEARLSALGAACQRVWNADHTKANLWARIGPDVPGGIVLSGHSDVVPVDGQDWTSDPFTLTERYGRLYGRGAADMKGFLALVLASAPSFAAARLRVPVHVCLTYDEEIGCIGAPSLIGHLYKAGAAPSAVLVGEPTEWAVVNAHKSIDSFWIEATGLEAHSSRTDLGVSAIMALIPVLSRVHELADLAKSRTPANSRMSPAHTTLGIGEIHGGTAINILARQCRFGFDLRCTPGDPPEFYLDAIAKAVAQADAGLKAFSPECGMRMLRRSGAPGLLPEPDGAAELFARAITGDNGSEAVCYAAEAGQFQASGFSTVLCGPGSIAQAHAPDEWIAISELERGVAILERLLTRVRA
jgi:acetylornithine deacetylase